MGHLTGVHWKVWTERCVCTPEISVLELFGIIMIKLTRRTGNNFVLNAELIKFVEEVPDTIITLRDGEHVLVKESADEVVQLALEYCRQTRFLPEPV